MRGDRGQDVIAGKKCAGLRVMQTNMIGGMAGRMQHEPFPSRELDDVAMLDVMCHVRQEFAATDGRKTQPAQALTKVCPLAWTLPGRGGGDALEDAKEIPNGVLCPPPITFEHLHMNRQVVDRGFAVVIIGTMDVSVSMLSMCGRPAEMKGTMGDDLGATFLVDLYGAAKMIWMGMRNEDGVNMSWLESRLFQAMADGIPGRSSRKTRVDDGCTVLVDQRVHVHMPETRNLNGQLHAKNILRHLGDFFAGIFLLLSFRSTH